MAARQKWMASRSWACGDQSLVSALKPHSATSTTNTRRSMTERIKKVIPWIMSRTTSTHSASTIDGRCQGDSRGTSGLTSDTRTSLGVPVFCRIHHRVPARIKASSMPGSASAMIAGVPTFLPRISTTKTGRPIPHWAVVQTRSTHAREPLVWLLA